MAQIFHRSFNSISRFSVFAVVFLAGLSLAGILVVARSPYLTNQRVTRDQPVQFDHRHHVGDDGIDCRYCHALVEKGPMAGVPPTSLCLNSNEQIWNKTPKLAPVPDSYFADRPIVCNKVNKLPHFVYFNHSIHVKQG